MNDKIVRINIPSSVKRGGIFDVRVRLDHAMESGLRTDVITGKKIPEYYVKLLKVIYGGNEVSHMDLTPGVSNNPVIGFKLKAMKSGPLAIRIEDNKGQRFEGTAQVQVK